MNYREIIKDLERRREEALNTDSKRISLDEVISEGYDNIVINAYKAYARGEKKFQITNNSILEWDNDLRGWTVKYIKDLGTVYFSDVNDIARIWSNIRQMETQLEYTIRDNRDKTDIPKY